MQDSYAGNIRDFAKYGLLRALTGATTEGGHLSLGVVWYYNGRGERGPDRMWAYLHEPDKYQGCDEDLFEDLQVFVDHNERSVRRVEGLDVLKGAAHYCRDVSRGPRQDWLDGALERTGGKCVVFLDPDIGLAPPSQRGKNSPKHAHADDVRPFVERDQTVVIYQSYAPNVKHVGQEQRWRDDLKPVLRLGPSVEIVKFNSGLNPPVQCAFIVLAAHGHAVRVNERIQSMVDQDWDNHFKRV